MRRTKGAASSFICCHNHASLNYLLSFFTYILATGLSSKCVRSLWRETGCSIVGYKTQHGHSVLYPRV